MKRFNALYEECLTKFNEAFSNYDYYLPKDKKEQLFDFYMLVGLQKPSDAKLRTSYEDALKTITKELRRELLNAVMFAVSAEFRHIFETNSASKIKAFFDKHGAKSFIKDYATKYKMMSIGAGTFTDRERKELSDRFTDNHRGYQESYTALNYAMNKNNISPVDFMEMAQDAFTNMTWQNEYGGKPWAKICKGWLMLEDAGDNIDKNIIAIDHVYDLQHNTDTVFNKLKSYYSGGGYKWIKKALDKKFLIKDMYEIYDDISAGLKPFAAAIIKDTTGQTLELWLKKSQNPAPSTSKKETKSVKAIKSTFPLVHTDLFITKGKYDADALKKEFAKYGFMETKIGGYVLQKSDATISIKADSIIYEVNKKRHRADGPAIELADGSKYWYQNGKLHREDGPAYEGENGDKEWYLNGKRHREDGPAIKWADGTKEWYLNGKPHREDGPAVEWADGYKEWYLNGKEYTEEEFKAEIAKMNKGKG